jgi:hypothetical protein
MNPIQSQRSPQEHRYGGAGALLGGEASLVQGAAHPNRRAPDRNDDHRDHASDSARHYPAHRERPANDARELGDRFSDSLRFCRTDARNNPGC